MEDIPKCYKCKTKIKLGDSSLQGGNGIYCSTCLKETCEKCSARCEDCQSENCICCLLKCAKCTKYFCHECQEKEFWEGTCDTCLEEE